MSDIIEDMSEGQLYAMIARLARERDEARKSATAMHRRAQRAESIIAQSGIVEGRPQGAEGRTLGRALANYAAESYREEADTARRWSALWHREARRLWRAEQATAAELEDERLRHSHTQATVDAYREGRARLMRERDEARAALDAAHALLREAHHQGYFGCRHEKSWCVRCQLRARIEALLGGER